MTQSQTSQKIRFVGIFIYAVLLVLLSLYVFVANDENKPIIEIFDLNYLIPVLIYAAGTLLISYGIFILLRRILNRVIAFYMSLIIGIPVGLIAIEKMLTWMF